MLTYAEYASTDGQRTAAIRVGPDDSWRVITSRYQPGRTDTSTWEHRSRVVVTLDQARKAAEAWCAAERHTHAGE